MISITNKEILPSENKLKSVLYLEGLNNVIKLKYLNISALSPTLDIICSNIEIIQKPKPAHKETDEELKITELKKHIPKNANHKLKSPILIIISFIISSSPLNIASLTIIYKIVMYIFNKNISNMPFNI